MNIRTITKKIKSFLNRFNRKLENKDECHDQSHVMTQEEKLDEELRETFPASDPPGHFSKSSEDRNFH